MHADDFDRDPALTLQLRTHYRPPADPAYWEGLEARVMERIAAEQPATGRRTTGGFATIGGWWEPFGQWTRVGSIVAAAALLITAWGLWASAVNEDRQLYEEAVEAMSTPLDSAGRPMTDAPREKTVSDLFRY